MTFMSEPDKNKPAEYKGASLWPPVLYICTIVAALFIAQQFEENSVGSGRTFLGWLFGLGAAWFFLYINWGKNIIETVKNTARSVKSIVVFLVVAMILGGIVQCSGFGENGNGLGGVPDSWRR